MSLVCCPQTVSKFARVVSVCIHSLSPRTIVNTAQTTTTQPCSLSHVREVGSANAGRDRRNAKRTKAPFAIAARARSDPSHLTSHGDFRTSQRCSLKQQYPADRLLSGQRLQLLLPYRSSRDEKHSRGQENKIGYDEGCQDLVDHCGFFK